MRLTKDQVNALVNQILAEGAKVKQDEINRIASLRKTISAAKKIKKLMNLLPEWALSHDVDQLSEIGIARKIAQENCTIRVKRYAGVENEVILAAIDAESVEQIRRLVPGWYKQDDLPF